jgi:hypothetical protein
MPKLPINYENACIYEIVCKDVSITQRYVGSTTNLIQRRRDHKANCNNENIKAYNFYVYQFIRENGNWGNWDVVLIEELTDCKDKENLHKRERHYIESLKAELNKYIPSRTHKENIEKNKQYQELNKKKISQKKNDWYEKHKNEISEKNKEYYENNKEYYEEYRKKYQELNKKKISQKKNDWYEKHKNEISEKNKDYRENNKEYYEEYRKKYYQNNKELLKTKAIKKN